MDKATIRKKILQMRDALSESEIREKSEKIKSKLFELDEIKNAKCIAFYITKGSEVDTKNMIDDTIAHGKKVLVPVTKEEIALVGFTSWDDIAPARFRVSEPRTKIKSGCEPDVIIVPGVAFDMRGNRVGYGKGYYDRCLKKRRSIRIGICFGMQLVKEIPATERDERMGFIITEKQVVKVNG